MFTFWLYLFISVFLAVSLGIASGVYLSGFIVKKNTAYSLDEYLPTVAERYQDEEGDGKAVFISEPTEHELEQFAKEQKEEWGIITGLKNVMKSITKK